MNILPTSDLTDLQHLDIVSLHYELELYLRKNEDITWIDEILNNYDSRIILEAISKLSEVYYNKVHTVILTYLDKKSRAPYQDIIHQTKEQTCI